MLIQRLRAVAASAQSLTSSPLKTVKAIALSFAASLLLATGAHAAHFVAVSGPATVTPGEQFTVDLVGDFLSLGLIAGGVEFLYDPLLFNVDDFQTSLNVDSDLSCPGAALCPVDPPGIFSIVWGQFLTDLIAPDAGPTVMGTLTLTAKGVAGNSFLNLVDLSDFTGGWFGSGFTTIDTPAFNGSKVDVIPVPAAVWLFGSALGLLGWVRRRAT